MLQTLDSNKLVKSEVVTDLEVVDIDGRYEAIKVKKLYVHNIPVHREDVPRREDVYQWEHLRNLTLPEIDSEVELLLGCDVPAALEPWDVINSENDGPYAVRTRLGWTINGPLFAANTDTSDTHSVKVNHVHAEEGRLEEQLFET